MDSDEERREREGSKSQQCRHVTNQQQTVRPSIHPSTRTCSQRKNGKKKTILAGDTSYRRKKHDIRNNRTGPQSALLPTPLRFRESIENIKQEKNVDHPTDRPTGIQSSLFFLCLNHSSFIIHSSYLLTIMNDDWPPDSVPPKGTTRSVRSSVTRKRTGRKWTRFFSALVCRYTRRIAPKMVLFSVWWAGRKAVASSSGSGSSK